MSNILNVRINIIINKNIKIRFLLNKHVISQAENRIEEKGLHSSCYQQLIEDKIEK